MGISEKAAYLKGMAKGLEMDSSTKEGKLLLAIVDVLEDITDEIVELQDVCDELDEVVDVLDEDLSELEEAIYEADDECGCGHHHDDEEALYEVTCPKCGDTVYLDEGMLEEGSMNCPNCNELLEFDEPIDDLEEVKEDDDDEE